MIYITGDTHGGFQRFTSDHFPQQKQMERDDYAIITGDFGGVWDDSPFLWTVTTKTSTGSVSFPSINGTAGRSTMSGLM